MLATAGTLSTLTRQPYLKLQSLSGDVYVYECETINAIDQFFMTECSRMMNLTDIQTAKDFASYQDGLFARDDLISLDQMFTLMVGGMSCIEAQGAISGC